MRYVYRRACQRRLDSERTRSCRDSRLRPRLGADASRLEGRAVVHPRSRRLRLRSGPGRRPGRAAELCGRDPEADRWLLGDRDGRADREPGARARPSRSQSRTDRRRRDGSTTRRRTPIQPKQTLVRVPRAKWRTCGRARTRSGRSRACGTALSMAIHRYFHEHGFFWVHTPIITASDAEGAGEMFRVSTLDLANSGAFRVRPTAAPTSRGDFFGRETFLTVSGQLNVETYCLRAVEGLHVRPDVPRREQQHQPPPRRVLDGRAGARLRRSVRQRRPRRSRSSSTSSPRSWPSVATISSSSPSASTRSASRALEHFVSASFERMTYTDAIAALERSGKAFEFPVQWGMDMQSEHERWLTEQHVKAPVVVMNYPKEIKAFYMRVNDDGKTVAAMDVLAPGIGEIIGGSQREERLDRPRSPARRDEARSAALLVVSRPAPLRHGAARRLRAWASSGRSSMPRGWPTSAT